MKQFIYRLRSLLYFSPIDKQLHAGWGQLLTLIAFFLFLIIPALCGSQATLRVYEMAILSFIIGGAIAGFMKEFADGSKPEPDRDASGKIIKSFNVPDWIATMVGSAYTAGLVALMLYIIHWTAFVLKF